MTDDTFINDITKMLNFLLPNNIHLKLEIELIRQSDSNMDWVWHGYIKWNWGYEYTQKGTAHFNGKNLTVTPF